MMTTEDLVRVMAIIVPLIVAIVLIGFWQFMKWSQKDRNRRD